MKPTGQFALEKTALALLSAVLYAGFFLFNGWLFSNLEYREGISWVFLPAGFRVILVLVLGFPGAIGLMLGSWFIDRTLFHDHTSLLAILNGLVSGLMPWLVLKYLYQRKWLSHQLQGLTSRQLLQLTLIFSAASAIGHQLLWTLLNRPQANIWVDVWPMFIGDVMGAFLMLYSFKFILDQLHLKASRSSS